MEHGQAAWWQRPDQASAIPSMLGLRGSSAVAAGLSGATREAPKRPAYGRSLPEQESLVVDVDQQQPGEAQARLEVTPVTIIPTELRFEMRQQIAVSQTLFSYALSKGHNIRALHKQTGARALLKGHAGPITDLRFSNVAANLLASASTDGHVFVWSIQLHQPADEAVLHHDLKLDLNLATGEGSVGDIHLAWHPTVPDLLAVAAGSRVLLAQLPAQGQSANSPSPSADIDSDVPHATSVAFSSDGTQLACATEAGQVLVWHLPGFSAGADNSSMLQNLDASVGRSATLSPFGRAPVSSVAWVGSANGSQLLLAGDATNARLALLGTDSGGQQMPVLQSLQLQSNSRPGNQAFFNHLAVLQAEGLVVLANTRGNAMYVISLGRKGTQPCFAHFSKFPVTTPILSLAARMVDEEGPSQGKAQLACTQTQAIQTYSLDVSICQPADGQVSASVSEPALPTENGLADASSVTPVHAGRPGSLQPSRSASLIDSEQSPLERGPSPAPSAAGSVDSRLTMATAVPPTPPGPSPVISPSSSTSSLLSRLTGLGPFAGRSSPLPPISAPLPSPGSGEFPGQSKLLTPTGLMDQVRRGRASATTPTSSEPGTPASAAPAPPRPAPTQLTSAVLGEAGLQGTSGESAAAPPRAAEGVGSGFGGTNQQDPIVEGRRHSLPGGTPIGRQSPIGTNPSPATPPSTANASTPGGPVDVTSAPGPPQPSLRILKRPGPPDASPAAKLMDEPGLPSSHPQLAVPTAPVPPVPSSTGVPVGGILPAHSEAAPVAQQASLPAQLEPAKLGPSQQNLTQSAHDIGDNQPSPESHGSRGAEQDVERPQSTATGPQDDQAGDQPQTNAAQAPGEPSRDVSSSEAGVQPLAAHAAAQEETSREDTGLGAPSTSAPSTSNQSAGALAPSPDVGPSGRKERRPSTGKPPSAAQQQLPQQSHDGSAEVSREPGEPPLTMAAMKAQMGSLLQKALTAHLGNHQQQLARLVHSEVVKEGKRLDGAFQTHLQRGFKEQQKAIEAERKAVMAEERATMEKLITTISGAVNRDLPGRIKEIVKQQVKEEMDAGTARLQQQLQASFASQQRQLGPAVSTAVGEALRSDAMAGMLSTAVSQPLHDALTAAFAQQLIPKFESAAAALFQQVYDAFETGMMQSVDAAKSSQTAVAAALQESLGQARALAGTLSHDLQEGQRHLVSLASQAASRPNLTPAASMPDPQDPTVNMRRLLKAGQYEQAFNEALSAEDVDIVIWLCTHLDPAEVLSRQPAKLSQTIILALIQQLGQDLQQDTRTKMAWLREAIIAIDPHDAVLAQHIRPVLEPLFHSLQALAQQGPAEVQADARVSSHIVRSMMAQCPY